MKSLGARSLLLGRLLAAAMALCTVANPSAAIEVSNVTTMTFDPYHGTQVEYSSPQGRSYLWYPGSRNVLPARWKVESNQMCFLYPSRSYNPVTKEFGGFWECRPMAIYAAGIVEQARGDIFGLSKSTTVPFALKPERTTLSKLANRDVPLVRGRPATVAPPGMAARPRSVAPKDNSTRLDFLKLVSSCEYAIKNQRADVLAMTIAAGIYFWGGLRVNRGKPNGCVPVDYQKAFELYRLTGDAELFNHWVKQLRGKAASGDAQAAAALQTVNLTPLK